MDKTTFIRVKLSSVKRMRERCKELLINENPVLRNVNLSDSYMFDELVNYYEKEK